MHSEPPGRQQQEPGGESRNCSAVQKGEAQKGEPQAEPPARSAPGVQQALQLLPQRCGSSNPAGNLPPPNPFFFIRLQFSACFKDIRGAFD